MLRALHSAAVAGARLPSRAALLPRQPFVRLTGTRAASAAASTTGLYDPSLEKDSCGVGFVVNVKGRPSRQIVEDADVILRNMAHRGACGCETNTGDGAGVMTAIPHAYYADLARRELGIELPPAGMYATGVIFLNPNEYVREESQEIFGRVARECGLDVLGWRQLPTDNSMIGPTAKSKEPFMAQVFVAPPRSGPSVEESEVRRRAYMLSKRATNSIPKETWFFVCSLSTSTITYKGQLTTEQLYPYFADLREGSYASHFALVHSRFSTNTFPSWDRAQPLRYIGHNGEINTVRGNRNWMRAREGVMRSARFTDAEMRQMYPVVEEDGSDSMALDNALEFLLVAGGRTLPEAMMMLVPEAWENDPHMDPRKRALYEHTSFLMEPWDGPANFAFADGRYIGGVLDRNGLRPSRYYVTTDDRVIAASEVGVLAVPDRLIKSKGRLQPGRMFLIDTKEGKIVGDAALKQQVAARHPYREWVDAESIPLEKISKAHAAPAPSTASRELVSDPRLPQYGYTVEHVSMLLQPMLETGKEALGSMGNDAPLACLSAAPRIVPEYFKQHFAQVTNPPIDPFREAVVMSLRCAVGPMANVLETAPGQARRLVLQQPVLTRQDLAAIKAIDKHVPGWKTKVVDITFPRTAGEHGYMEVVERACREVSAAIASGHQFAVLSDSNVSADRAPAGALVVLGAVHQHLVRNKQRLQIGLIVETGEAREVHHHCTLIGFGADAVCPYLVYEIAERIIAEGRTEVAKGLTPEVAEKNYIKAVQTGMLKVMAKMGISTLQGYKGAQIFEAVGIGREVMDRCFSGTASRIGGVDFAVIAREALARHDLAYPGPHAAVAPAVLPNPGDYHWRDGGEQHMNSPAAVANLQDAVRRKNKRAYDDFARAQQLAIRDCTLRGLFEFDTAQLQPVPIEEVEPAQSIVRRFVTGAMSYGSISLEAHTTLAAAMNAIGGKSNTGEGGEDPSRYSRASGDGPNLRSAIKQIASGRFGVTIGYLTNADELQIKMAQGAKPGEGGELPGHKVVDSIAKTRHSTAGVGLISPPPHHDIYSIEDLAQLIFDLKCSNPVARISVKLVSEAGVGVVAAGVAKGHADHILISGHDGGTGASSWTGIKHAGLPWELGLAETHQTLVLNDLRGRVVLQTDGQLRTGRDVVLAALLGAEEFGFSTAPLIALGCTMMRKCHLNTCPVGIATQDPVLRKKFEGQPEHVVNFFFMVAEEARQHMARLGFRTVNEMIGRTDLLRANTEGRSEKVRNLDLSAVLTPAYTLRKGAATYCVTKQDHGLDAPTRLDNDIIARARQTIADGGKTRTEIALPVTNVNRVIGTTLSHEISKAHGEAGLPDDSIRIKLTGTAGQSLGAFLSKGVTIELDGDANDYVGKGLSGGTIVVRPGSYAPGFVPQDNIIVGNVCLYGATSGRAFIRGVTAERFCVRNSGATAVCEGVGDHGCEYMTGGRAVILGTTGRNFAAGMSGGIAYVLDRAGDFRCNMELVKLGRVEDAAEAEWLRETVAEHARLTGSTVASELLASWPASLGQFVRVMPVDYERVLNAAKEKEAAAAGRRVEAASAVAAAGAATAAADKKDDGALDKLHGFMLYDREKTKLRDATERLRDWEEIAKPAAEADVRKQASRCMDCGVPFCQSGTGCPIGNIIPKWNDLVHRGRWREAYDQLALTNNFPEFTGRVCPAPCEGACVLGINADPVAIKGVEVAIIDRAFSEGWVVPRPPPARTGQRIAVVGSGPAGLAAADQLNRAGHTVTVFERADRVGGLLMYGIPNMKLDKRLVQRRVDLLEAEGVSFVTNAHVGENVDPAQLVADHDAVVLAVGSTWPRDLPVPGRDAKGIHFAMDYLTPSTKRVVSQWDAQRPGAVAPGETIDVKGKDVVVIGGGDTGVDCIATALRQGAKSVRNFEINVLPGQRRASDNPWPNYPRVLRTEYGHAEAAARDGRDPREFSTMTKEFLADSKGRVAGVATTRVQWSRDASGNWHMSEAEGSEELYKADVVLLALGYTGPEGAIAKQLGLATDARSNLRTVSTNSHATSIRKIFVAGDCRRGQSLIVWAIREGRAVAREVDIALMGQTSLPISGGVVIPQVRASARDRRVAFAR